MGKTSIEWCDFSFNPWLGCAPVSPACQFCYAESWAKRSGLVEWGVGEDRRKTSTNNWLQPLKWDRAAAATGRRSTVFCLSLGDIWDNEVDPLWRRQLFELIESTPNLVWLLLSKRIGNAVKMCDPMEGAHALPRNCALGATMVNQEEWDRDAPKLAKAVGVLDALFSFVSIEPMLGPIKMGRPYHPGWVILGGESGPHARPMHPQWVRDVRDQCASAGVPFFFKQHGEWLSCADDNGEISYSRDRVHCWDGPEIAGNNACYRVGKKAAGRLLDGVAHDGFPSVLTP